MKPERNYLLIATECRDYSIEMGWERYDHQYLKQEYESKDDAINDLPALIKSLNVAESDVYEIDLVTMQWDNEYEEYEVVSIETIEIIDGSSDMPVPQFMLSQYFGQYMIPKGKYDVSRNYDNLTRNQILKCIEPPSFRFSPVEVFNDENEVREYLHSNNITNVSGIELYEDQECE